MAKPYKGPTRVEPGHPKYDPETGGRRKYVNRMQCAAVYRKGARAGKRCSWYAKKDSIYCRKHGAQEGVPISEEHAKALHDGSRNWWARMRAIEAQRPGFLREFMGPRNTGFMKTAKRDWHGRLLPQEPLVVSDDPIVIKGAKVLQRELNRLPTPPDKPVEEMNPQELLIHNTYTSLHRIAELLRMPIKKTEIDERGQKVEVIDYKAAAIVKDAALRASALQVKVDGNALKAQRLDRMAELLERLKAPDQATLIEALPAP